MAIMRGRRMEKEVEVLLEFKGNRTILHSQPSQLLGKVETELCGFGDNSKQKVYTLSDVPKEPRYMPKIICIFTVCCTDQKKIVFIPSYAIQT